MNREYINTIFEVLKKVMRDQNVLKKPAAIYNMDETGFQINKEVRKGK